MHDSDHAECLSCFTHHFVCLWPYCISLTIVHIYSQSASSKLLCLYIYDYYACMSHHFACLWQFWPFCMSVVTMHASNRSVGLWQFYMYVSLPNFYVCLRPLCMTNHYSCLGPFCMSPIICMSWTILYVLPLDGWMNDLQFYILFNSVSIISGWCLDDNERLCAMELRLWLRRCRIERWSNPIR